MKAISLPAAGIFALALTLGACKDTQQASIPPPNVKVVEVVQMDIPIMEEFVGQTFGLFDIAIQARVEGFLESIHFDEGRRVREGQLLYTIDAQPFEANVASYESQVAEAKTMLSKAESDLARIRPLAEMNAVSQSDLDAALAARDAAQAGLEAAHALLRAAKIELGYTSIYSPIDGIIGKTEAFPGDFVGRGSSEAVLNEVSRIDTILVNFHLPEEQYLEISRPFLESPDSIRRKIGKARQDLTLILADASEYPEKGRVRFVNRQVNPTTGTILLQAAFPNEKGLLRPGQFARVKAFVNFIPGGMLIPLRCLQELQGNYSLYVVNEENIVEFREVEVSSTYATSYAVVTSGLSAGEKVVYEGLQKIKGGAKINPILEELSIPETEN